MGFEISAQLKNALFEVAQDALMQAFIEFIEARGLLFGGGLSNNLSGFIVADGRNSATDADRESVQIWLTLGHELINATTSALRDAWYGWDGNEVNTAT